VEQLLRIADELARRDDEAAQELRELDALRREVEETRVGATAVASFLSAYPDALASRFEEERAAAVALAAAHDALAASEAALEDAEGKHDDARRLSAARAVQNARDALHDTELRAERADAERVRLEREHDAQETEAVALERRAAELGVRVAANPRVAAELPRGGLDGVLDWSSRARGALIVARSGVAAEQDRVIREASELSESALGEPLPSGGVAELRERLSQ
jgi:hypothetical protein